MNHFTETRINHVGRNPESFIQHTSPEKMKRLCIFVQSAIMTSYCPKNWKSMYFDVADMTSQLVMFAPKSNPVDVIKIYTYSLSICSGFPPEAYCRTC